eukprot:3941538-Rhodomonas_salina.11
MVDPRSCCDLGQVFKALWKRNEVVSHPPTRSHSQTIQQHRQTSTHSSKFLHTAPHARGMQITRIRLRHLSAKSGADEDRKRCALQQAALQVRQRWAGLEMEVAYPPTNSTISSYAFAAGKLQPIALCKYASCKLQLFFLFFLLLSFAGGNLAPLREAPTPVPACVPRHFPGQSDSGFFLLRSEFIVVNVDSRLHPQIRAHCLYCRFHTDCHGLRKVLMPMSMLKDRYWHTWARTDAWVWRYQDAEQRWYLVSEYFPLGGLDVQLEIWEVGFATCLRPRYAACLRT